MASGDVLVELPPSTPTPSTSDISILAQQQREDPQPIQGVQEAFKIPDVLYTAAFSILWLFGLARNLASYVVSLGIIPLKTATQLFGIKPIAQTRPHPILAERDRTPGSRHTRVEKSSALTNNPRSRHGWNTHTSGKASSSSTDSTITSAITRTTGSAPGTPRKHHLTSLPAEALTDSEHILHRPRNSNRHTAPASSRPSRLVNVRDASGSGFVGVSEEGEVVETKGGNENGDESWKRARSRSRVDHSTRRILFIDPKNSRRQTAPPVPYHSQSQSQPPLVSGVEVEEKLEMTESPLLDTIGLPSVRSQDSQHDSNPVTSMSNSSRPKSIPNESISRPTTNEFGEFVSAPTPAPADTTQSSQAFSSACSARFPGEVDRDATASGTESTSERRSRGKERFRSGFKLFGKKRSSSVASTGEGTVPEPTPCASKSAVSKSGSNKLRRKSPYPGRLDLHGQSSTEAVHKQHLVGTPGPVSVSDVEATSTTWLRSRPKKLTRRARSNSLSEGARVQPLPTSTTVPTSQPSTDTPAQMASSSTSPLPTPPLVRSSTMASTSTSASASSTNPTTNATSKRNSGLSFNPLRDLEARLYYRHGVGTGPNTADVSSYVTTPIPKTGIKRTNPYVLLGVESPRGSPSASSVHLTSSRHGSVSSPRPTSSNLMGPPGPPRRVSAPAAGGGGGDENVVPLKRPNTPSRAHTQPL